MREIEIIKIKHLLKINIRAGSQYRFEIPLKLPVHKVWVFFIYVYVCTMVVNVFD